MKVMKFFTEDEFPITYDLDAQEIISCIGMCDICEAGYDGKCNMKEIANKALERN